jgi:3-hydroxyisobutyrate dehydrogenase-like beta-hydroxyacid dehydrogenase
MEAVGFIGLGNMGSVLAHNLVASGHRVVTHDLAGPSRSPVGAEFVPDVASVAARTTTLVLSLPDGDASEQVARQVVGTSDRQVTHLIDTSTIGLEAARTVESVLAEAGIFFVDAPVSGGVAGARARTLTVMYAGDPDVCRAVEPILAGLSDRRYHVGSRPGAGQALKLANNFLSATALAAASEAVAFGTSVGLDMGTMLEVLNASSGQSAATSDKFVQHVLTGRYSSGFANTLMAKDLQLYLRAASAQAAPSVIGQATAGVWERFAHSEPDVDFTRIYPFCKGS